MAAIQVYAPFPQPKSPGIIETDAVDWRWIHCLTIPLESYHHFQWSGKPFKWIRFVIGVVIGAQGHLSLTPDALVPVNYDDGLPIGPLDLDLYYHVNTDERTRMFPTDPHLQNTKSKTNTSRSDRWHGFPEEIRQRDRSRCVVSDAPEVLCEAAHLLAHSKNEYIQTYTEHRSRDPDGNDIVTEIDNVQNGLFLHSSIHKSLGTNVAFLKTPNFAMDTTDIDPTAQAGTERCSAHLFSHNPLFLGDPRLQSGTPLRIADNEWPPDILFDAVYAKTVMHHFATQKLYDVLEDWKDMFYPGGVKTSAQADLDVINADKTARDEAKRTRALEREERRQRRGAVDISELHMVVPYMLFPPDQVMASFRKAKEKAAAAEQQRVRENIDAWMHQVASA